MIVTWECRTCGDTFEDGLAGFNHRKTNPEEWPHHVTTVCIRLTGIEEHNIRQQINQIEGNYGS